MRRIFIGQEARYHGRLTAVPATRRSTYTRAFLTPLLRPMDSLVPLEEIAGILTGSPSRMDVVRRAGRTAIEDRCERPNSNGTCREEIVYSRSAKCHGTWTRFHLSEATTSLLRDISSRGIKARDSGRLDDGSVSGTRFYHGLDRFIL